MKVKINKDKFDYNLDFKYVEKNHGVYEVGPDDSSILVNLNGVLYWAGCYSDKTNTIETRPCMNFNGDDYKYRKLNATIEF